MAISYDENVHRCCTSPSLPSHHRQRQSGHGARIGRPRAQLPRSDTLPRAGPDHASLSCEPELLPRCAALRRPSVVNRPLRAFCCCRSFGVLRPGVASGVRVREVADPKCWCAGVSRPRWILETPRIALPDPHPARRCQRLAGRRSAGDRWRRRSCASGISSLPAASCPRPACVGSRSASVSWRS